MSLRSVFAAICATVALSLLPAALVSGRAGASPLAGKRAAAASARCTGRKAVGPFHVVGTAVRNAAGQLFIPYGITVPELSYPDWHHLLEVRREIAGAAGYWCANTIRLQLAPGNLVGPGGQPNAPYLRAVRQAVDRAESDGLVVVLSAQTENFPHGSPAPTEQTERFWRILAGRGPAGYGRDRQVVFDLFNEPRLAFHDTAADWHAWLDGSGRRYVGMQHLADIVRRAGASNLLWVEGPDYASTLDKVASYRLRRWPVVYDFHHPLGTYALATPAATLQAQWETDFGYLTSEQIAPVVDGEWANYTARAAACWPDAHDSVWRYLAFLQSHGIGMTAWALKPGVLIQAAGQWWNPTMIRAVWQCGAPSGAGAGNRIRNWYRAMNQ